MSFQAQVIQQTGDNAKLKIHERELQAEVEALRARLRAIERGETPPSSPHIGNNTPSGPLLTEPTEMEVRCMGLLTHDMQSCFRKCTGPWFNIKMPSYQSRKSHCGDKTVVRSSYLHNGISYTGKMSSLYWIRALVVIYLNFVSFLDT